MASVLLNLKNALVSASDVRIEHQETEKLEDIVTKFYDQILFKSQSFSPIKKYICSTVWINH